VAHDGTIQHAASGFITGPVTAHPRDFQPLNIVAHCHAANATPAPHASQNTISSLFGAFRIDPSLDQRHGFARRLGSTLGSIAP
jgi:hypothetical protein